jgi:hypothetical protein
MARQPVYNPDLKEYRALPPLPREPAFIEPPPKCTPQEIQDGFSNKKETVRYSPAFLAAPLTVRNLQAVLIFFGSAPFIYQGEKTGFALLAEGARKKGNKVALISSTANVEFPDGALDLVDLMVSFGGKDINSLDLRKEDREFMARYRNLPDGDRAVMRVMKEFDNPAIAYMIYMCRPAPPTTYVHGDNAYNLRKMGDVKAICPLLAFLVEGKEEDYETVDKLAGDL